VRDVDNELHDLSKGRCVMDEEKRSTQRSRSARLLPRKCRYRLLGCRGRNGTKVSEKELPSYETAGISVYTIWGSYEEVTQA